MKKRGVSLIVLIIVIIVIIIISSVGILSLNNTNVINNSKKTVYLSKIDLYKSELEMYHYNEQHKGDFMRYDPSILQANSDNIQDIITSMPSEDVNDFVIQNGELLYAGENELEKLWSRGIIGILDTIPPDLTGIEVIFDNNGKFVREVNVTINKFPSDSIINEYSFDGEIWNEYKKTFKLVENCDIYIRATDAADNQAVKTVQFDKIDRINPTISDFKYSVDYDSIKVFDVIANDNQKVEYFKFAIGDRISDNVIEKSYEFKELNSNTNYNITVTAYDQAGNFASKVINATTLASYLIKYDDNYGNNKFAVQQKIEGSEIKLITNQPIRNGYLFLGWNTNKNGKGISYNPGDIYDKNESLTLYAIWRKKGVPILGKIKVGDYIEYTANNYSKWRVLYSGNEGYGIQIISDKSVGNVNIDSKNGYVNYIDILNKEAKKYVDSKFAISARCVGSNINNPNSYNIINNTSIIKYYKGETFGNATNFLIQGHYKTDYDQLRNNNMLNIGQDYYLAARNASHVFLSTSYEVVYIDSYGSLNNQTIYSVFRFFPLGYNLNYGLRPCVKLYENIEIIDGDGTLNNPYQMFKN